MSVQGVTLLERTLESAGILSEIGGDLYCRLQEGDCFVTDIFRHGRNEIFCDLVYTIRGLFLGVKKDDRYRRYQQGRERDDDVDFEFNFQRGLPSNYL